MLFDQYSFPQPSSPCLNLRAADPGNIDVTVILVFAVEILNAIAQNSELLSKIQHRTKLSPPPLPQEAVSFRNSQDFTGPFSAFCYDRQH